MNRQAAEAGNMDAAVRLGTLLQEGQGTPRDPLSALYWWEALSRVLVRSEREGTCGMYCTVLYCTAPVLAGSGGMRRVLMIRTALYSGCTADVHALHSTAPDRPGLQRHELEACGGGLARRVDWRGGSEISAQG